MRSRPLPQSRTRRRQVAVLIETTNTYARGLLRGVAQYFREHPSWSYYLIEQRWGENPLPWLARWRGDGVIARIESPTIARAVLQTRLPAVDVTPHHLVPSLACFSTDDEKIAHLAIDHFLERGFKHFAFCSDPRFCWARSREAQFAGQLRALGHVCDVFNLPPRRHNPDVVAQRLGSWIRRLPRPVGIMACYDRLGRQVLDACREAGLAVPYDVAVIGVDNDELLCNLASPPLSSVIDNADRTGYEAAALLASLMAGEKVEPGIRYVAPLGIAARQSTDVVAVNDREIARAAQFIREHACEGIRIDDVLQRVPLSRRVLEQRFQRHFGVTPREEIQRVRLNRVRELLTESDLAIYQIAERTGFEHVEYLSVVFKRETGLTPREYREQTATRRA